MRDTGQAAAAPVAAKLAAEVLVAAGPALAGTERTAGTAILSRTAGWGLGRIGRTHRDCRCRGRIGLAAPLSAASARLAPVVANFAALARTGLRLALVSQRPAELAG